MTSSKRPVSFSRLSSQPYQCSNLQSRVPRPGTTMQRTMMAGFLKRQLHMASKEAARAHARRCSWGSTRPHKELPGPSQKMLSDALMRES